MNFIRGLLSPVKKFISKRNDHPLQLQRPVLFVHMPKCAGTSVERAIRRACFPWGTPGVYQLDSTSSAQSAEFCEKELLEYRQLLLPYFMLQADAQYVTGHFGISKQILERFSPHYLIVTLLRDPVERFFSHYFFNRALSNRDETYFKIQDDLEKFVQSETAAGLGNLYVRNLTVWSDATNRVEAAIEMIERIESVGFVEHLGHFARQFEKSTGVSLEFEMENRNPIGNHNRDKEITPRIRDIVRQLCEPDLAVYNHALKSAGLGVNSDKMDSGETA